MSSSYQKRPKAVAANTSKSQIPTDFLLSLATGPMLLGILSAQAVFSWLEASGIASEELFRGQRLPVLHFPNAGTEEEAVNYSQD